MVSLMTRALRLEYPGEIYHVTARGNERKSIYRSYKDRVRFLEALETSVSDYRVRLYAYSLMRNHYHSLIEASRGISARLCSD